VKYVLVAPGMALAVPGLEPVYEGEIGIWRNREALPRAFFVPGYELAPDRAAAYRALGAWRREDFLRRVLLESPPPPELLGLAAAPGVGPAPEVRVTSYRPNRVELELESRAPGFVVLADGHHPSWRARVNGREAPVLLADYALRAVGVGSGASRIVFEFRPAGLRTGFLVTIVAWSILLVVGLGLVLRSVRRRAAQTA
jgi:hypothetical protein